MIKVLSVKGWSAKEIEKEIFQLSRDTETHFKRIISVFTLSEDRLVLHIESVSKEDTKW